jgi:hypothetical protein
VPVSGLVGFGLLSTVTVAGAHYMLVVSVHWH